MARTVKTKTPQTSQNESSWDAWRVLALENQGQRFMPQERTAGKPTTRRSSDEEKQAAVRMVRALRPRRE